MWTFLSRVSVWPFYCWLVMYVLFCAPFYISVAFLIPIFVVWIGVLMYNRKSDNNFWEHVGWLVLWILLLGVPVLIYFTFIGVAIVQAFWIMAILVLVYMKQRKCWRGKNMSTPQKYHEFWDLSLPPPDFAYFCSPASTWDKYKFAFSTCWHNQFFRPERKTILRTTRPGQVMTIADALKDTWSCIFSVVYVD